MTLTIQLTDAQLSELVDKVAAKVSAQREMTTYSYAEAAKVLGVSKDTIERRIKAGLISKVPNLRARIPASEIERLLLLTPTE